MVDLTHALDLPLDAAFEDFGDDAKTLAAGEGSAIAAAAAVAAVSRAGRSFNFYLTDVPLGNGAITGISRGSTRSSMLFLLSDVPKSQCN